MADAAEIIQWNVSAAMSRLRNLHQGLTSDARGKLHRQGLRYRQCHHPMNATSVYEVCSSPTYHDVHIYVAACHKEIYGFFADGSKNDSKMLDNNSQMFDGEREGGYYRIPP